nr:hypothetical protein [Candidatus Njordarchaeota archaeon]
MRSLLNALHDSILVCLAKNKKLLDRPSLTYKSKERYGTCSGNFFFKEPGDIKPAIDKVIKIIENTIRSHIGSKGEIIKSMIRGGEIWDRDKRYFGIKAGAHFESYCFACKTLTFVRVTWEKQLFAPEKEWLSIDVDEVQDTIWLEES